MIYISLLILPKLPGAYVSGVFVENSGSKHWHSSQNSLAMTNSQISPGGLDLSRRSKRKVSN